MERDSRPFIDEFDARILAEADASAQQVLQDSTFVLPLLTEWEWERIKGTLETEFRAIKARSKPDHATKDSNSRSTGQKEAGYRFLRKLRRDLRRDHISQLEEVLGRPTVEPEGIVVTAGDRIPFLRKHNKVAPLNTRWGTIGWQTVRTTIPA